MNFQMSLQILVNTTTTAKIRRGTLLVKERRVEMEVEPFSRNPWYQRIHKMRREETVEVRGTSSW